MEQTLDQPETSTRPFIAPHWRDMLLAVSLLAVIALGVIVWQTRLPAEGSTEVYFARDMIAHHEQAVKMAFTLHERGVTGDLRIVTEDIFFSQHGQIGQMQGWLTVWGQTISGDGPPMGGMGEMMGMATREQAASLETLPLPEAEVQFLQLMIRHHQGGVMMAQEIVGKTKRPEVLRLAEAIISAQQSEIKLMTDMLAKRGAKPLPPLQPMTMEMHGG